MVLVAQESPSLQVCTQGFACWVAAPVLLDVFRVGGVIHPQILLHCPALPGIRLHWPANSLPLCNLLSSLEHA